MTTPPPRKPLPRGLKLAAPPVLLAFVYLYPRLLTAWLGDASPWTSYFYMYGFGLVFFCLGLLLIRQTGACIPGRGRDGFWFKVLLGGFVFFAGLHATWILLALTIPHQGAL